MRVLAVWLLLLAPPISHGAAAPLDEVRRVLAEALVPPPTAAQLQGLDAADLANGLRGLDPHARWFPHGVPVTTKSPAELEAETGSGVGASLSLWGDRVVLVPYAEGPLAQLGFSGPVRLTAVDGVPVTGVALAELGERMLGAEGTPVSFGLFGDGEVQQLVTVVRGPYRTSSIEPVSVSGRHLVRIRNFVPRETCRRLLSALDSLADASDPVILDLRDSPGGDLFEAMDCAAMFLPEGAQLAETHDGRGDGRRYRAPAQPKVDPGPLVLWVGPGTASAAEIFAAILRHHGLARLVGAPTRGKCSSQTDRTLSDGSVLRFSNLEVTLPDGRSCSGTGLDPDVPVEGDALLDGATLLGISYQRP